MPKVVKKNKTKKTEEDSVEQKEPDISVFNRDGLEFLEETESGVIDLVLTDGPVRCAEGRKGQCFFWCVSQEVQQLRRGGE